MGGTTTLLVRSSWQGEPVGEAETATVALTATRGGLLIQVDAPFHDDPPPPHPAGPTSGLWNHEVVEVFIAGPQQRYTEVELGPHGHHLVLRLEGIRNAAESELPLDYVVKREGGCWRGRARLPWTYLPKPPHTANAYAIHGQGDLRRYLAAHPVPGDEPDFHRLACFVPVDLSPSTWASPAEGRECP